jgi:hypothetical protein
MSKWKQHMIGQGYLWQQATTCKNCSGFCSLFCERVKNRFILRREGTARENRYKPLESNKFVRERKNYFFEHSVFRSYLLWGQM